MKTSDKRLENTSKNLIWTKTLYKKSQRIFLYNKKKWGAYGLSILIWLFIWHIAASCISNELFLPSPLKVFDALFNTLIPSENFWSSLLSSLTHICFGFFIGSITGILLAIPASFNTIFEAFIWFPVKIMKSVPVASFVILVLLWLDADDLAIFIPAMIVLPTLYINTLTGIKQTNYNLLDMATLFRVPLLKRILHIYIPNTIPYILSACSLAMGMAWKAGVAAEIIGLAKNSIGNELYKTKIYLMTPELFAWTILIVVLSILCESAIKLLIKLIEKR